MFVKVRTIDGKTERTFDVSKLISVEDFKVKVGKEFDIEPDCHRLFYRGKQLENGYTIYHYGVGLGDVLQLVTRSKAQDETRNTNGSSTNQTNTTRNDSPTENGEDEEQLEEGYIEVESPWCETGDLVDCLDRGFGAWFEARIVKILQKDANLVYRVQWQFMEDKDPFNVTEDMIRPRARRLLSYDKLATGLRVMINYNTESPKDVGFWFDMTISKIKKTRTTMELTGTIYIGSDHTTVENCTINPRGEIYAIEEKKLLADRDPSEEIAKISKEKRRVAVICKSCNDDHDMPCKDCGCTVCSGKEDPKRILLCDECDKPYHLHCLVPPLHSIPEEDDWYCPSCKNDVNEIVKAGDKLKATKKKLSTVKLEKGQRDWGMGMACVGRTAICTIVPQNHVGPIPGIEVGMSWEYRVQVSESGVHRPHVAGIHGRESECAFSIVLSGGYEDDVDNGEEFIYTGSGGRDLTGNKRTASQSSDQMLTRMNRALALNCDAPLNNVTGATAKNWRNGKPVRVVRSSKLRKHSKYAPKEGNRYDGIYKVVRYFPRKGKSGFSVWRYVLRRDDPTPAPWTHEGRERIESLGLTMARWKKMNDSDNTTDQSTKENAPSTSDTLNNGKNEKVKRKKKNKEDEKVTKKVKLTSYELDEDVARFVEEDVANTKLWEECCKSLADGKIEFLKIVSERYLCVCCQEIVYDPVTTPCCHNICLACIKRSFRAGVHCCPTCRHPMNKNDPLAVNETLSQALQRLFPGYGGGR